MFCKKKQWVENGREQAPGQVETGSETASSIPRDLQRSTFVRKKSNAGCLSYALLWGAAGATAFVVSEQFESSGVLSLSQMAGVVYAWHFAKAKGWLAAIAVVLGMRGAKQ